MDTIKKLLFVTKFDDLCFDAMKSLLNLRSAHLDHVVFLTVIEKEKVALRRGTGYQKEEELKLKETANIRFIDWAETLFELGMEVGVYITVGSLAAQVIEAAKKEASDLIVIGRSPKGVLKQLYSGSDVTELIRRTAVPVLVYKANTENATAIAEKPFERPLLAVDGSPASMKAVELLKPLKGVIREVSVIHVADPKTLSGSSAMAIQKTRKETRAWLDDISDALEAEGLPSRSHVYIGEPVQEIEKAARECDATLIVMGSSSKSAWMERWIGSTSRTIAENSAFPTLLVPPNVDAAQG